MSNPIRKLNKWWKKFWLEVILTKLCNIHRKKPNTRDALKGIVVKERSRILKTGAKVITVRGYAQIIKMRELGNSNTQWLLLGLGRNGYGPVEHDSKIVKQYFVQIRRLTGKYKVYPLKFSDYTYLDQYEKSQEVEVYITNKGYAALTDNCKKEREHITFFNCNSRGKDILKRLKENNYSIVKSKN